MTKAKKAARTIGGSLLIRIPHTFYFDHVERDLDAPHIVHRTKQHLFIRWDDPALAELLDDARHYADSVADMGPEYFGLCMSARATEKAIRSTIGETRAREILKAYASLPA